MTSEQQYDEKEAEFVRLRDEFKGVVYGRIETLIREKYPHSTGFTGYSELDDGEQYVGIEAVLDPTVDGGKVTYDELEEDEGFYDQLANALSWLDVVDPNDYRHGFTYEWDE